METVLQFGAGRFLRAFADLFVHEVNAAGTNVDQIVVVQSTPGTRALALQQQGCVYHVAIRGRLEGTIIDNVVKVESVSRSLVARNDWPDVLEFARSPSLQLIVSNTTEAGYRLTESDQFDASPPESFPAKLVAVLFARFDAGRPGVSVLPCELFERNAERLFEVVDDLSRSWGLPERFGNWLREECSWRNSLVDRIVVNADADHPLRFHDPLLLVTEPYALWAVEEPFLGPSGPLPAHRSILEVPDATPFHLRKVRILNGAHTALVCKAVPMGFKTVRDAVNDPHVGRWLRELIYDEIVPAISDKVEGAFEFADQSLERFDNPFIEHRLEDIALHHQEKIAVRLIPTFREFSEKFGKPPPRLSEILGQQNA